jgi:hypothetical protein
MHSPSCLSPPLAPVIGNPPPKPTLFCRLTNALPLHQSIFQSPNFNPCYHPWLY